MKLKTMLIFSTLCMYLCSWMPPQSSGPQIHCPDEVLLDEEIEIEITGLEPNQLITVEASWIDFDQIKWISRADFLADSKGIVKIKDQEPISGSYEGTDVMGLFWSMTMQNIMPADALPDEDALSDVPYILNQIKIFEGKREITNKAIFRLFENEEVKTIKVREDGLVGNLYLPPSETPLPVVIILTGSNGGMSTVTASLLASHGIAAFALAYSGIGNLPPTVEDVHIEYFETAFKWIENCPQLNGEIALFGTSRGAELALLLGSMFPEKIQKIVARAPSSVVLSKDSWIYHNEPILPAAPYFIDVNNDPAGDAITRETPFSNRIYRERGFILERENFEAAALPVEKIACPILLVSGGDDQAGPCSIYAEQILNRIKAHGSTIETLHLDYPNAGHLISIPYLPRINVDWYEGAWWTFGGTPLADEYASRDSWSKILYFLKSPYAGRSEK